MFGKDWRVVRYSRVSADERLVDAGGPWELLFQSRL